VCEARERVVARETGEMRLRCCMEVGECWITLVGFGLRVPMCFGLHFVGPSYILRYKSKI